MPLRRDSERQPDSASKRGSTPIYGRVGGSVPQPAAGTSQVSTTTQADTATSQRQKNNSQRVEISQFELLCVETVLYIRLSETVLVWSPCLLASSVKPPPTTPPAAKILTFARRPLLSPFQPQPPRFSQQHHHIHITTTSSSSRLSVDPVVQAFFALATL